MAAVEFAFIAPVLILIYFGLAELCQAMIAERKASHAASAIGDLVAQNSTVNTTSLDDIFNIATTVVKPFPVSASTLKLCAFSATKNAAGNKITVDWNRTQGSGLPAGFCPAKAAVIAEGAAAGNMPTGLIGANESVIVSKSLFTYTGPTKYVVQQAFTFNPVFYLRPRKSDQVVCTNC